MSARHRCLAQKIFTVCSLAAIATACEQPPPPQPAPPAPPPEVGRFQVVVTSEGQGNVLFLLDTEDGNTWIYRPPSTPLINGFWSDIPRVTYPQNYWQAAFQQMMQGQASTTAPSPNVSQPTTRRR
jgi:hypothetical protein